MKNIYTNDISKLNVVHPNLQDGTHHRQSNPRITNR